MPMVEMLVDEWEHQYGLKRLVSIEEPDEGSGTIIFDADWTSKAVINEHILPGLLRLPHTVFAGVHRTDDGHQVLEWSWEG